MSGRTPIWRAILWIERSLPTLAENPPQRCDDATTNARASRWRFAIVALLPLIVALPTIVQERAMIAEMWPVWRAMILQLMLLVAMVAALAAIVSGVVTWRRERRNHA